MKELADRLRFIELRAQGKSLATIGNEIGVSRQTLANWERAHAEEIWRLHSMELDALEEEYWMKRHGRIELFGTLLRRVKEELERRDLSDVPTAKLVELELKLIPELKKLFSITPIMSESDVTQAMLSRDKIDFPWTLGNRNPERRTPLPITEEGDNGDDGERGAD